jgi:hypothetical protein
MLIVALLQDRVVITIVAEETKSYFHLINGLIPNIACCRARFNEVNDVVKVGVDGAELCNGLEQKFDKQKQKKRLD